MNRHHVVVKATAYNTSLRDGDTRFDKCVRITHTDGTDCFFQHAFYMRCGDFLVIFTEHTGVYVYHFADLHSHNQFIIDNNLPVLT